MPSLPKRRRLPTFGCVVKSSGTTVRAQMRSVATLIEVSGTLRVDKTAALQAQLRRFVLLESPLVLDLTCLIGITGELLQSLVGPVEIDCSIGNVELYVVVRHDLLDLVELQDGTDVVDSVGEALRSVIERIRQRRSPAFIEKYAAELLPGA
jgi:hypothetical protein